MPAVNGDFKNTKEYTDAERSRENYVNRKNQVLDLLKSAKEYYQQENDLKNLEVFSKLSQDIENGEFSIVVVGEFSSGKSTLLNALMGRRILPSFSNETTATVNFLRHKDKSEHGEAGRVYYTNGEQKVLEEATIETIEKFVSTKGDNVAKRVDHLDLYLDSKFLKDGVTLVDSPGLNGIAERHREITKEQIQKSHASIFLFNSDHPGSKTDFEFLNELQNEVNTIIFALNKIDEIHKDEGETPKTIVEYLKKSYKYKFPDVKKVPEIWPIAAYPALVARNQEPLEYQGKENRTEEEKKRLEDMSGLGDFENRLFTFLTCGEKAKQQLLSPVEKVLAAAKKTQGKYKEESAVLEKKPDMSEMENQILEIKKTIDELKQQILDSENAVRSKIKDELKTAIEDLTAQMARLNEQKRDQIDKIEDLDELEEYQHNFEKVFIQRVSSIEQKTDEKLIDQIVSVIKDQSFSQMEIIEQRMKKANVELRLSVDEHLEIQETVFKVGLEEMNKEEEALEYQLKQLEEEATKAELDFYRARKIEREKKNIEREIENLKKKEENIKNQVLPRVERYTEKRIVHEKRGGVFGRVADVLVGEKRVESFEYIKDDSERKEVREMRDKNCRNIESEIKQKEAELSRKENVDSVLAEQIQIRATAQANAKREELVKTKEKHIQEINKNYKRKMRRMKKEFLDYCDYITEELLDQMEKSLKKSEQLYIDIVLSSVGGTLKKVLTDKQEDLKQLERKLQESEEDRNIRIETLKKKINSINELIGQALDLHTELSNIAVDKIQQEDI